MKKSIILLALIISIMLVGCSDSSNSQSSSSSQSEEVAKLEQRIAELEDENIELKERLEKEVDTTEAIETQEIETEAVEKESVSSLQVGDIIETDRMEITIKNIEFSYNVLPDDTSSFYTHYEAESGSVYIHIDTDVKNLQKQNLDADDIMTVEANYNNGYMYSSFTVPEDSTGFTYANITSIKPLETLGVRFLIECPQEVEESDNSVVLNFKADKQSYEYIMR